MNSYEKIAYSHGQHGSSGVTLRKAPQARPNELQPLVTLHAYLSEKLISQKILATLIKRYYISPRGTPTQLSAKTAGAPACAPPYIYTDDSTQKQIHHQIKYPEH